MKRRTRGQVGMRVKFIGIVKNLFPIAVTFIWCKELSYDYEVILLFSYFRNQTGISAKRIQIFFRETKKKG